ncbi:MAG: hypothetical protein SCH39_05715 [Methanosarcinales archaeon]|nr:hypothetical protein [Methanosarcinales archaeon]
MVTFESIKRMMGWCPILDKDNYQTLSIHSESLSIYDRSNTPKSLPLYLNNIYADGFGKEAIIGIFIVLTIFAFTLKPGDNSFYHNYRIELIILSMVLMQYLFSRSKVEITGTYIRVSTMLHCILGSTTHSLDSIDTIYLEKNRLLKLGSWGLFIVGLSDILLLFKFLFAGKTMGEFAPIIVWIIFCFGWGYIAYSASRSYYHIRISFNPYPSINAIAIYTKDVREIADLLEEAGRDSVNYAVDDDT